MPTDRRAQLVAQTIGVLLACLVASLCTAQSSSVVVARAHPIGAYVETLAAPKITHLLSASATGLVVTAAGDPEAHLSALPPDFAIVDPWATVATTNADAKAARTGPNIAVTADRIFVADTERHQVRVFTRSGSPLFEFGSRGHAPGEFVAPRGIAVTPAGEVIVADTGNHRIQMFATDGTLHRYWGDWGPHPGFFSSPHGVTWSQDRVYVADRDNHRVQVFDPKGNFIRQWGRHAVQPREGAGAFHYPESIAISADGNEAFVLEPFEQRIQRFRRYQPGEDTESRTTRIPPDAHMGPSCASHGDLLVLTEPESLTVQLYDLSIGTPVLISQFGDYGNGHAQFRNIADATIDPTGRFIDVTDAVTGRWQRFAIGDRPRPLEFQQFLCRFAIGVDCRRLQSGRFKLRAPEWLGATTTDTDGNHYVIDRVGDQLAPCIVKLSKEWEPRAFFGSRLPTALRLREPTAIAYDRWEQRILVVDRQRAVIARFSPSGDFVEPIAVAGRPYAIAVTESELFVTNQEQHEVIVLDRQGQILRRWGQEGLGRSEFLRPAGITVTSKGRVIVVDHGNHRGQIFDRNGTFLTAFGARTYVWPTRQPAATNPRGS
ncbi:MAG: NHL repeat-containing protein [Planctomycetota bacterium]